MNFVVLPHSLAAVPFRAKLLAGFLFGAIAGLGHSPLSLPLLTVGALVLLMWLFGTVRGQRQATSLGWVTGSGYFAVTMSWIVNPFLVDAENQAWMAPFALVFLATGLALFWALGFWVAYRVGASSRSRTVALVFSLTLAEMGRSYLLTGFPWGLLAYVWVDNWVMQWAAWVGPHGLGVVTFAIAAVAVTGRNAKLGGLTALAFLGMVWLVGHVRSEVPEGPKAEQVWVRLVQPNAPQKQKWDQTFVQSFFEKQLRLTAEPSSHPIDLIIWPETSVPFWLEDTPNFQRRIAMAADPKTTVVIGVVRAEGSRVFNSLAALGPDGSAVMVYDKSHLVPFAEYIPFGDWLDTIGVHGFAPRTGDGFSAGPAPRILNFGRAGKVLPLICYEAIFPQLLNQNNERPDWILQITNDAWFGHISGPQQHLAQAQMRAVEQGVPFIRVANTGVSAVINANGRIVASLPLETEGKLDAVIPGAHSPTLYSRTGDWPLLALMLLGLTATARLRRFI